MFIIEANDGEVLFDEIHIEDAISGMQRHPRGARVLRVRDDEKPVLMAYILTSAPKKLVRK